MTFLAPWALLWLASIPALVWLWRMSAARRHIRIPSLVPFERLLQRSPKRRSRLVVNALFWLQLAALIALSLALARPVLLHSPAKTVLVILDTSASMQAGGAMAQAKQALRRRLSSASPSTRFLIITSAPPLPLLPQPLGDRVAIGRSLQALRPSDMGGNLATAARIGGALLSAEPDETIVVTDEAPPPGALEKDRLQWLQVGGGSLANVAIIGLDAHGPLCRSSDERLVATVENFSRERFSIEAIVRQEGRALTQARAELAAGERRSLTLVLPEGTSGLLALSLIPRGTQADALEVDNQAWVEMGPSAARSVVLQTQDPSTTQTIAAWLGACSALAWRTQEEDTPADADRKASGPAPLLITDREADAASSMAAMIFSPPVESKPALSYWMSASDHPIGWYLRPVEVVAGSVNLSEGAAASGVPVVSSLVQGRNIPIVVADEQEERRVVRFFLDPSANPDATALALVFFNSLRWLLAPASMRTTGEPLSVGGFGPGEVRVESPDGSVRTLEAEGEIVRYDATLRSGEYRFVQGKTSLSVAVNFLDPLESNLIDRASTWSEPASFASTPAAAPKTPQPLSSALLLIILSLLLIEWWRYSARGQPAVVPPQEERRLDAKGLARAREKFAAFMRAP